MATNCTITHIVEAPLNRVAELLRTSLAQQSFKIELVNDDMCELTAHLIKSDRNGGTVWNYEYHVIASWMPESDGISISLDVQEHKNSWTSDTCKTYCLAIMQGVVDRAAKLKVLEKTQKKPDRYGSAKWATLDDIKQADYWGGYEDSRRLLISTGDDEEYVTITPEDTVKHAIVCGPTGSGKTSAIFIPNLIDRLQTSAIVTEATAGSEPPDLYTKTSGYRSVVGRQDIFYFNPDDLRSDSINPIDSVKSYAHAQDLARLLIENTTSKNNYGDDVWPKSEANLLTVLIAHAAALGKSFGYIRKILREGPDGLVPILAKSLVDEAREEFRGFTNTARDGFKYGVVAGLMQRLGLWVNPRICALTETTSIDLSRLKSSLFTFYLAVPAQKIQLKPVAALIFNFILDQALKEPLDYPLYLSLDEFTNFGMIPAIAQKLGIIRHQNIPMLIGVQDFIQLQQVYGKEDSLFVRSQPATKIFFRPRTMDVAKSISELAGMTTIYERKVGSSGQITERETPRALIDPAEVLAMDEGKIFVTTARTPPLMLPRFTWQEYQDATCFPPVAKPELVIDERLVKETEEAAKPMKEAPVEHTAPSASAKKSPPAETVLESIPEKEIERKPQPKRKPSKEVKKETEVKEVPKPPVREQELNDDDEFGPGFI